MASDIREKVNIGDQVFCAGRTERFGSVRDLPKGSSWIDVWIENHGDVAIESEWIVGVHDGKVELDCDRLPAPIRSAIRHAHDRETG